MIEFSNALAIFSSLIAFLSVAYNIYHSRKTTYINAITTSRLKYMDSLRNQVAEFCGLSLHLSLSQLEKTEQQQIVKRLDQLRFTIKLHLNRKNQIDAKLIEKIDLIPNLTAERFDPELEIQLQELTAITQDILALEWNGIKTEASQGSLTAKQKREIIQKQFPN